MTWLTFHSESERFAASAELASRSGNSGAANELFAKAAHAEAKALASLDPKKSRTYGITAVSAVALWCKAGDIAKAERVAREALETGALPHFAIAQLAELVPLDMKSVIRRVFDQLIEEFRELESAVTTEDIDSYESTLREEVMRDESTFGFITDIAREKGCSFLVVAAAVCALGQNYVGLFQVSTISPPRNWLVDLIDHKVDLKEQVRRL